MSVLVQHHEKTRVPDRGATVLLAILLLAHALTSNFNASGFQPGVSLRQYQTTFRSGKISLHDLSNGRDTIPKDESAKQKKAATRHQCRFCSASFPSRNALFRHVRSDPICAGLANEGIQGPHLTKMTRQTMALLFAYCSVPSSESIHDSETPEAELAGSILREAIREALNTFVSDELKIDVSIEMLSSTQASVAKLRHKSLSQERGSAAAGDVMIISFMVPAATQSNLQGHESSEKKNQFSDNVLKLTREKLKNNKDSNMQVRLVGCTWIPSKARLHAERSCTQRVYHYMLPVRWLPDGQELERWWLRQTRNETRVASNDTFGTKEHHQNKAQSPPPSNALRELKKALRSAESAVLPHDVLYENRDENNIKVAAGRFGAFALKERRPWHNFADPKLKGDASPNNEPVWRALDRVRIDLITTCVGQDKAELKEEVIALLEFRGDDFLQQQVRRIVGTALAVTHGWLPPNVFNITTRADVFIPTIPLAPSGRLYFAAARFHFDELQRSGREIFDGDPMVEGGNPKGRTPDTPLSWIQEQLLHQKELESSLHEEEKWLQDLQDTTSPRVREFLAALDRESDLHPALLERISSSQNLPPPPIAFIPTLSLLRDIVSSKAWPDTTTARSSVIRNVQKASTRNGNTAESIERKAGKASAGSFTIVNPRIVDNEAAAVPLPLGNTLFPELVDAVFDLELALAEQGPEQVGDDLTAPSSLKRKASSHCAVNCNAEFTPHVDSGRGAGQSLSMIVGLGDYVGGELLVEGNAHDIRYKPLEFDGWKLRHWTNQFVGERFSLVWFTPEKKANEQ